MEKYLFGEKELREMNLSESEMLEVMFWDKERVSYLFDSHHRGSEWSKFIEWVVCGFLGNRRIVNLLDCCEYMANRFGVTIEKAMKAVKEEESSSKAYFTCDLLGEDVIECSL